MINQIVKSGIDNKNTSSYRYKVYQIDGVVQAVKVIKDKSDPAGHGRIEMRIRHPEYVAIQISCYFADQDESKVEGLQVGQQVKVRGQLHGIFPAWIEFYGCVLD